jgi:hypothetical protein
MSPPDARAGARLRVATMFTGAGAIDYGCVARDARRRDGAGNAGNAKPNAERTRTTTTTDSTRDDDDDDAHRTRDRDDKGRMAREDAKARATGAPGGRTRD